MATGEYREFFLRHTQVNTGSKPDQEKGFDIKYYVGQLLVFNRFMKGDYPSESVFAKLFASLAFKKNVEDTSTTITQGLARTSTDTEAKNRTTHGAGTFQNHAAPEQLPDLISEADTVTAGGGVPPVIVATSLATKDNNGIRTTWWTRTISGERFRKDFSVKALYKHSITVDADDKNLILSGDAATPGNNKAYATDGSGVKGWINLTTFVNTLITSALSLTSNLPYTFTKSVKLSTANVQLENDETSPGNDKVYATSASGVKGWRSLLAYIQGIAEDVTDTQVPAGVIVMWRGHIAPDGWTLCNGDNGTPDLRGRFIVGWSQNQTPVEDDFNPTYSIDDKGGENKHLLLEAELPAHNHDMSVSGDYLEVDAEGTETYTAGAVKTHASTPTVANAGGDERHENRPPYYALAYIMKITSPGS